MSTRSVLVSITVLAIHQGSGFPLRPGKTGCWGRFIGLWMRLRRRFGQSTLAVLTGLKTDCPAGVQLNTRVGFLRRVSCGGFPAAGFLWLFSCGEYLGRN